MDTLLFKICFQVLEHLPGANRVCQDFALRLKQMQYKDTFEITDLSTEVCLWNFEASALLVLDKRLGKLYKKIF